VSIAGGASNKKVLIRLPNTNLRRVSVHPSRRLLRRAYTITNRRFLKGRSSYQLTLGAVESIPTGSYLTFTFRAQVR
jgi:hypothetical protein